METNPSRSSEDVITLAEHAKLIVDDLLPVTQSIYFGQHFGEKEEEVKLLEMNQELLATLEQGDRMILRGEENDHSVICTKNKTFEVRVAETSNSLLLVPDLKLANELPISDTHSVILNYVTGLHQQYLELTVCKPKVRRLKTLLEENLYSGKNSEDSEKPIYHFDNLLNTVQASEEEIITELKNLKAYQINGYWRLLEFDYHFQVLSQILNLIESNSWSLDNVPHKDTIETLSEIESEEIIAQCFQYFFEQIETEDIYRIIDSKVSCFCAEMLLRASEKFNLEEFLVIWQQSVPEGIITNLSQLEGVAIVDETSPASIKYFASTSLPENAMQRFSALFDERPKWTMNEIRPYIIDVATDQSDVSNLLAKYARSSTQDGIKCYSSKYLR